MSVGPLFIAVMGLLFISGLVQAFVFATRNMNGTRQEQAAPPMPNKSSTIIAILRCWLAPTGLMAVFVALSGAANREWENIMAKFQPPATPVAINQVQDNKLASNRPKWITDGEKGTGEINLASNRPLSIADGEKGSGDIKHIILSSRMWSTSEEAEQELKTKVAAIVRADFGSRHHGWFDPKGQRCLSEDQVCGVAVKKRHIESANQDFGKFSAPMYQIWWQVEISPMVRTELYPAWKSAVVQNRIVVVGTVLALITMLANGLALFAALSREAGRGVVQSVAVCVFGLGIWMSLDLLLAARLLT